MIELVKMTRDAPTFPGGPMSADVHPDDVAQWVHSGWMVGAEAEFPENATDNEKPFDQMTLAELREYAKAHGIVTPTTITAKADVLAHILASGSGSATGEVSQPQA